MIKDDVQKRTMGFIVWIMVLYWFIDAFQEREREINLNKRDISIYGSNGMMRRRRRMGTCDRRGNHDRSCLKYHASSINMNIWVEHPIQAASEILVVLMFVGITDCFAVAW